MNKQTHIRAALMAASLITGFSGAAFAELNVMSGDRATQSDASTKAIRVREETSARTVKISVTPGKKEYRVNEKITFNVKGSDDYYLYVFNIDNVTGESVLLIPNERTKSNLMHKNKSYTIPGTVEFYSDSEGTEQIIFVASKNKIDLSNLTMERIGPFTKTNTNSLENAFSSKSIHVREIRDEAAARPAASGSSNDAEGVKILSLRIRD